MSPSGCVDILVGGATGLARVHLGGRQVSFLALKAGWSRGGGVQGGCTWTHRVQDAVGSATCTRHGGQSWADCAAARPVT